MTTTETDLTDVEARFATEMATVPTIAVAVNHPVYGSTHPFSYLMLQAACTLADHCRYPDQRPAYWALEENALTHGWQQIANERNTGVRFQPSELHHIVWLARALIAARDAEAEEARS